MQVSSCTERLILDVVWCVRRRLCCSVVLSLEMESMVDPASAFAGDGPYLVALPYCGAQCCVALLCLEPLDSSWKSNLNTHTTQTLMTGLSPLPRPLSDNVQR